MNGHPSIQQTGNPENHKTNQPENWTSIKPDNHPIFPQATQLVVHKARNLVVQKIIQPNRICSFVFRSRNLTPDFFFKSWGFAKRHLKIRNQLILQSHFIHHH